MLQGIPLRWGLFFRLHEALRIVRTRVLFLKHKYIFFQTIAVDPDDVTTSINLAITDGTSTCLPAKHKSKMSSA